MYGESKKKAHLSISYKYIIRIITILFFLNNNNNAFNKTIFYCFRVNIILFTNITKRILLLYFSLLGLFGLLSIVKSQTCVSTSQYGVCSSNSACGCLPISFTDNIGICSVIGVSCSRLSPCKSDDTCENTDHICVHHPQCSSSPVCYPLSMSDERLCPPMRSKLRMINIR